MDHFLFLFPSGTTMTVWIRKSAYPSYATSGPENPDDTFVVIITLNLCFGPCTEVHKNSYWKRSATKITQRLKLFPVARFILCPWAILCEAIFVMNYFLFFFPSGKGENK